MVILLRIVDVMFVILNVKLKKSLEISFNLLGSSFCVYNRIVGKVDESIKLI